MDNAAVVSDFEIGVVILVVSDPGQCVDEGDGLVIVLEPETAMDHPAIFAERPVSVDFRYQRLYRTAVQLTGFALAVPVSQPGVTRHAISRNGRTTDPGSPLHCWHLRRTIVHPR